MAKPIPNFAMKLLLNRLRQHRERLAQIYQTSPPGYRLLQLSPQDLKQQGISVLVLDFDGVLAAYGELSPVPELDEWLQNCLKIFGASQVFILSNKPLAQRITYLEKHYQGVRWITGVRKKPDPQGLETILEYTGQPASSVMLVDDRLLTGALAACIANVRFTYITRPYVQVWKRPIPELFFWLLRFLERRLVQWY